MASYIGLVALASSIDSAVITKNAIGVPLDADSLPTYRVYGPAGYLASGSLSFKDTGIITNAPPANPTVYTCVGHNLTVGTRVTTTGIGGNTAANTTGDVTAITSNTFTIAVDSSGSGAFSGNGAFHATGVYDFSFAPTIGANFQSGIVYSVTIYGKFSTVNQLIDQLIFQVT